MARFPANAYPRLNERIRNRKLGDYTAFYDALGVYLRAASTETGQKVLVAYTDGEDTRSSMHAGEVTDLLKLSDVTMYALGYLSTKSASARNRAQMELQRFSGMTGGQRSSPRASRSWTASTKRLSRRSPAATHLAICRRMIAPTGRGGRLRSD